MVEGGGGGTGRGSGAAEETAGAGVGGEGAGGEVAGGGRGDGGGGAGVRGAREVGSGSGRRGVDAGTNGAGDSGTGRGSGAAEEIAGEGVGGAGAEGEVAGDGRGDGGGGAGVGGVREVGTEATDAGAPRAGFVAIVGLPGAGKSTLLNRLVGESLAIVSPKPQTTRRRILGIARRPGLECILLDTPGIHRPRHGLGKAMMRSVAESLGGADLALAVVDGVRPGSEADLDGLVRRLRRFRGPKVIGINKSDVASRSQVGRLTARFREAFAGRDDASPGSAAGGEGPAGAGGPDTGLPDTEVVVFSARTGANVESPPERRGRGGEDRPDRSLLAVLAERLPFGPPLYEADRITDLPEAFFAAEEVRERMLTHLRQEVPHAAAVRIEEYDDSAPKRGLVRIRASVLVDRDSQRGIVIGRGGGMLKRVGSEARAAIESRLGRRVFLGLQVKVRSGWRDNPGILRDLGL